MKEDVLQLTPPEVALALAGKILRLKHPDPSIAAFPSKLSWLKASESEASIDLLILEDPQRCAVLVETIKSMLNREKPDAASPFGEGILTPAQRDVFAACFDVENGVLRSQNKASKLRHLKVKYTHKNLQAGLSRLRHPYNLSLVQAALS